MTASAPLGDFGLAKLYEQGANPTMTRVVVTLGYLAPELTRMGKAAADVFAFEALVLEVLAGRRPIEPRAAPKELVLAKWAWEWYAAGRWRRWWTRGWAARSTRSSAGEPCSMSRGELANFFLFLQKDITGGS